MAGTRESQITAVAAAAAAATTTAATTTAATATTKKKMMMTMTTTTTMMLLFFFVWFMLLGGVNAPSYHVLLVKAPGLEELLGSLDGVLERLDTIASNVEPPLPVPLMAAAVLFVFCTTAPARFAAAWSRVVRWAKSVVNPPVAAPADDDAAAAPAAVPAAALAYLRGWFAMFVVGVDRLLSPFKLEDKDTEARIMAAEARATAAEAHAEASIMAAEARATAAEVRATAAEARVAVVEAPAT
ncbi:hypothetical protein QBC46DRAFT_358439 [Diplogelasinospora grovesii]|uniref:Uncharacterized protein n=1 Tax=Diplogelasinospora grovesii TaxID=303347 RepID=A0AAN6MX99_9PEZI|nr:hypothetical protein QBC46DRAFT_358439 [Diplogelasinospora grovesii]